MTPGSIVDLLDLDRTDQPSAGQAMAPQAPFVGRPLLTEGLVRRRRAWGTDEAEVLVRQGDQVSAGQAVARLRRPGRATALDAAAILGLSPERVESSLLCAVGDMLAEGDVLAERRALAGLQRRVLRSPASGRLSYVSPAHGTLFIQPQAVESAVIAHLSGEVVAAGAAGGAGGGPAPPAARVAGAGRAAAGKRYRGGAPTALPTEPGGGLGSWGVVREEGPVVAMAGAGAVGILAPGIADATIQRLGWDDLLWTAARGAGRALGIPPGAPIDGRAARQRPERRALGAAGSPPPPRRTARLPGRRGAWHSPRAPDLPCGRVARTGRQRAGTVHSAPWS